MAAPHRSSAALRKIAGTHRPDRDAGEVPAPGELLVFMPPAPRWIAGNEWAFDEWNRLGPILLKAGLLTEGNIRAFAALCASYGRIATDYEAGGRPTASELGQFRNLICEFGLTPASAAKVRAPDPTKDRGNKFASNGKPDR